MAFAGAARKRFLVATQHIVKTLGLYGKNAT